MTFTIIIPAYNCEKTLAATVDSVRAAGLYDYEILLVDDGSRDGTPELCDQLSAKWSEVRCIHQKNAGVSAARNRGMDEATGEYLWFVDADDTVEAGSLAAAAKIVAAQQPDLLIFGLSFDYYFHGKRYRRDDLLPPCAGMRTQEELKADFCAFYDCNALTPVWNKLYRRRVLQDAALRFREDMMLMEDFFFVLETLPHCDRIYCLPKAVYRYRQGEDEQGAYRRLQRIPDLAEYLAPFEAALGAISPEAAAIFPDFYRMMLGVKLYYAARPELRKTLYIHHGGRYAALYPETDGEKLYRKNRKSRLRHWLAIRVKSTGLYQRLRG